MKSYNVGNLKIDILEKEERIELIWLGKSDDREPANTLTPFFSEVMQDVNGKPLLVNFAHLSYMNSSTVRPILQMLQKFDSEGIDTTIIYDADITFQKTSFSAIEMLTKQMKHITVEKQ